MTVETEKFRSKWSTLSLISCGKLAMSDHFFILEKNWTKLLGCCAIPFKIRYIEKGRKIRREKHGVNEWVNKQTKIAIKQRSQSNKDCNQTKIAIKEILLSNDDGDQMVQVVTLPITDSEWQIWSVTKGTNLREQDRSNRVSETQFPSMKAVVPDRDPPTVGVTPRRHETYSAQANHCNLSPCSKRKGSETKGSERKG